MNPALFWCWLKIRPAIFEGILWPSTSLHSDEHENPDPRLSTGLEPFFLGVTVFDSGDRLAEIHEKGMKGNCISNGNLVGTFDVAVFDHYQLFSLVDWVYQHVLPVTMAALKNFS